MKYSIGRQVVVLIVLVLLLILVGIIGSFSNGVRSRTEVPSGSPSQSQSTAFIVADADPALLPPPVTAHMQEVLDKSHGFAQFISYTDNGFEPPDTTIRKGQAVRFTNNSSHDMWIMSSGGDGGVYPAVGETCGQTSFDTCVAFPRNEIWEFTFTEAGTWVYRNNNFKDHVGVIRVK